jgi:hypothetical protein
MLKDDQIEILVAGIRSHWAKPDAVAGATPPPYAASTKGDPQRGSVVFTSFCASCHGPDGQGTEKLGSICEALEVPLSTVLRDVSDNLALAEQLETVDEALARPAVVPQAPGPLQVTDVAA